MSVPDAPWIREAETFGMPEAPEPECPICGRICDDLYISDADGSIVGCNRCIRERDAAEWMADHKEDWQ